MAKTVNRQPIQFNYPTSKQVKSEYFNHYTWKGINDDKNFLEVDQEALQEAENVYVDSEGILRSRPALKQKVVRGDKGNDTYITIRNIYDFWVFGDIFVYQSNNNTDQKTYLYFINKKNDYLYHSSNNDYTKAYNYSNGKPVKLKLVIVNNKIFVFTESSLDAFEIDSGAFISAQTFIYTPNTKIITANTETDNESPNILTNQEIYTYLYDNVSGFNIDIIGKQVKLTFEGNTYTVDFTENTPLVLSSVYCSISNVYSDNDKLSIAVSKDGVLALYSNSTKYCSISVSGKTFDSYYFDNYVSKCSKVAFSDDGSLVYFLTDTGIYVLSVYSDNETGIKKYPSFTNIIPDSSYTNFINNYTSIIEDCTTFTGTMIDDERFAVIAFTVSTTQLDVLVANESYDEYYYNTGYDMKVTPSYDYTAKLKFENTTIQVGTPSTTYNCDTTLAYVCYQDYFAIIRLATNQTYVPILVRYDDSNVPFDYSDSEVQCRAYDISLTGNKFSVILSRNDYVSTPTTGRLHLYKYEIEYDGEVFTQNDNIFYNTSSVAAKDDALTNVALKIGQNVNKYASSKIFTYQNCVVYCRGLYNWSTEEFTDFVNGDNFICGVANYIYYYKNAISSTNGVTNIYFNYVSSNNPLKLDYYTQGNSATINFFVPSHVTELHNYYLAIDNIVRISQDRYNSDGDWLWYLPKTQSQQFNYEITGLHPISDSVVAVFMENEVDYITYDTDKQAYLKQKSKLQLGLPKGNNVISSLDGTTSLFVTKRGLVAMGYQDFIASTEQSLTYLSDIIFQLFNDWNNAAIRLHLHGFWLICYKQSTGDCYIYDIRTKSWWHCTYTNHTSNKFVTDGVELMYLVNQGKLFDLDRTDYKYYDDDNGNGEIEWYFSSQKLYLGAVNYYKHIENITFNVSLDSQTPTEQGEIPADKKVYFNLQICNYRHVRDVTQVENFGYTIDLIRTFVKRLNFGKVCEFQYRLSSDTNQYPQYPLSLADVTIRYKIAGQVR